MKITNKISLLVIFLLGGIISNAAVGLVQISKIQQELHEVAERDLKLTQIMHAISKTQLEKAILFERLVRAAEEIAFEEVSDARKQHLFDFVKQTKVGFNQLAEKGALSIIEGKSILSKIIKKPSDSESVNELNQVYIVLEKIEINHIHYDKSLTDIVESIRTGKYELSLEDINKIRREDNILTHQVSSLLDKVQGFTKTSLNDARKNRDVAQNILWNNLLIAVFVGGIVALSLVRSIAQPLKKLLNATERIGAGKFDAKLDIQTNDEISEVAEAFNTMTSQLDAAKQELQMKNEALSRSLDETERQKRDLEKVNKELDDFVYTVSHDIRSPLTGMAGYVSILEKQYDENIDERGKKCILGLRSGVDRINQMILDLLELTKVSRIQNPYELIKSDDMVDVTLSKLEFKIEELKAMIKIADHMPAIVCDRIKIEIVFFNLINNALKFSSKKPEGPKIEVGYTENAATHEFTVKDNGIGIALDEQEKVFGMFKRLDSAQEFEGTGAGLSIVSNIIKDHGGRIWIESEEGVGSTFHFTISKDIAPGS